jgi:hypothetical protein
MRRDAPKRVKRRERKKKPQRPTWIINPPTQGCTITGPMASKLLEVDWVML